MQRNRCSVSLIVRDFIILFFPFAHLNNTSRKATFAYIWNCIAIHSAQFVAKVYIESKIAEIVDNRLHKKGLSSAGLFCPPLHQQTRLTSAATVEV